jgi:hypothetical protein
LALKNISVRENVNFQFRAGFFNISNTPQFAGPGQVLGTGQFGLISRQAGAARQIQFGLKLIY